MTKKAESDGSVKQTTVEEGTQFKGTLQSNCQVMVRGKVEGDLSAPSLVVSATGAVVGNVKAEQIRSEGVLAGHVDADDVYLSGSVRSDTVIRAKSLEVKLSDPQGGKLQVTFGECILDVGDDPRAQASVPRKEQAAPRNAKLNADEVSGIIGAEPPKSGAGQASTEEGDKRQSVLPPS